MYPGSRRIERRGCVVDETDMGRKNDEGRGEEDKKRGRGDKGEEEEKVS